MTKTIRAPILLDESTARMARQQLASDAARVRRVAVVRPYGLDESLEVSELLPPASDFPQLTDQHLASYEAALDAFLAGQWTEALELLHDVPARDRVKDFLTIFIAQHNRTPPPRWDRVVPLESKG
jgi:adenylate cyclase